MHVFYLTLSGSLLTGLFFQAWLPWWTVIAVALLSALVASRRLLPALTGGGLGVGLAWVLQALVIHLKNDGLLTGRMSQLILQPLTGAAEDALWIPVLLLLGGLLGAMGAWAGYSLRLALGLVSAYRKYPKYPK